MKHDLYCIIPELTEGQEQQGQEEDQDQGQEEVDRQGILDTDPAHTLAHATTAGQGHGLEKADKEGNCLRCWLQSRTRRLMGVKMYKHYHCRENIYFLFAASLVIKN